MEHAREDEAAGAHEDVMGARRGRADPWRDVGCAGSGVGPAAAISEDEDGHIPPAAFDRRGGFVVPCAQRHMLMSSPSFPLVHPRSPPWGPYVYYKNGRRERKGKKGKGKEIDVRGKLVMVAEEEDALVTRRPEWLRALGSGVEWGIDPLAISVQVPRHALRFHTPCVPLGVAGGGGRGSQSSPSPLVAFGEAGGVRSFPLASPGRSCGARCRGGGGSGAVIGSWSCAPGLYFAWDWEGGRSSLLPAVLGGGAVAVVDMDSAHRPSRVWECGARGDRGVVTADGGVGHEGATGVSSLFPVRLDGSSVRMGRRRTRSLLAAAERTAWGEWGSPCCGGGSSSGLGSVSVLDLCPGRWMVLPARFGGSVWLRVDDQRSSVLREGLERMRAQCSPPRSGIIRSVKS